MYRIKIDNTEYTIPNPKEANIEGKNQIETDGEAAAGKEVVTDNKIAPDTCTIEIHASDIDTITKSGLTTSAFSSVRSLIDTFNGWRKSKIKATIYTRYQTLTEMVIENVNVIESSEDHQGAMVIISFIQKEGNYTSAPKDGGYTDPGGAGGTKRKKPKDTGKGETKQSKSNLYITKGKYSSGKYGTIAMLQ